MKPTEAGRLFQLLIAVAILYGGVHVLVYVGSAPQLQTILWKFGSLPLATYFGYWVFRWLYRGRVSSESPPHVHYCRVILIAAFVIAAALGM